MKPVSMLLIIGLAVSTVGCDSSVAPDESARKAAVMAAFRSATATPLASKTADGEPEYLLEVSFDPSVPGIRLPESVNVLPQVEGGSLATVNDDGLGSDAVAGDGVFSAVVPDACVAATQAAGKSAIPLYCSLKVVAPGETCLGYGECPERVHRSLLWGLIEYDTDVVFCFCVSECQIGYSKRVGV